MPAIKSAKKRVRSSGRKRRQNQSPRTLCKTNISKAEKLIASGKLEAAAKAVLTAISTLDKAAEKGVIPPNNAARRKSRLMQKLNKAQAPPSAEKPAKSQ